MAFLMQGKYLYAMNKSHIPLKLKFIQIVKSMHHNETGTGWVTEPCRLGDEEMNTYRHREPNPSCPANSLLTTPIELESSVLWLVCLSAGEAENTSKSEVRHTFPTSRSPALGSCCMLFTTARVLGYITCNARMIRGD
jgi:hypothetical protein